MSLKERLNYFHTQVLTNNWAIAKQPIFARRYLRLQLMRRSTEILLSACLIFGGQQFLIQNSFFLPLWPATGVGLAVIFLRGYFLLVGIFIGSFASYLYNHFTLQPSLILSLLFTGHIFLIRWLAIKLLGAVAPLNKPRDFLALLLIMILITLSYQASLSLVLPMNKLHDYYSQIFFGCLGSLNGILCLLPLSLAFDPFVPKRYFQPGNWRWRIGSLGLLAAHFLFFFLSPNAELILAFSLLLLMSIYAYRFGLIPISITWLGISVLYLSGALPPFHLFRYSLSQPIVTLLLFLFTLNLCLSLLIGTIQQRSLFARFSKSL